ncbi:MAG: 30S ribosomal protein S20 [Bacteroidota bacterium]|nr:30S ribosomal protein S20 [Bacteroidota bacterium]
MANHKSAEKRNRQGESRRLHNKYFVKSMRSSLKKLRATTDKEKARDLYPKVSSMLDKLVKKNIIHKKKAANLKSSLTKHVNSL